MSLGPLVRRAVLAAAALFATACTVGPDYSPPQRAMPTTWRQARESGLADGVPADGAWWRTFEDPLLAELVESALQQNLDLRAAFARLESARALRGIASSEQWPTIDARASYEHREESLNTPFGAFIPHTNIHTIAADASWELDLWGRVRRSIEAAEGDVGASEAELRGAALTVAAEMAATYIDLRQAQRRYEIAQSNLDLQERTLALVRARLNAGLVVEREVAQAATTVESTRSRLPALDAQAIAAQNRIAVLLGKAPAELPPALLLPGALPVLPTSVAVGMPADLLRRRPDVQAAERRFAAEVARIGVAEAERYPQLSIGGTLGLSANSAKDVFTSGSDVSAFGPSLRWNLFDGGRLRNRVKALQANAEAAQIAWEQTVLRALEETENAMTRFVHEQSRRTSLDRAATSARRAVDLAQSQYRAGLSDFQTVIDSQRAVALIEDELASSSADIAGDLVAIYKSLGGGVVPEAPAPRAGG